MVGCTAEMPRNGFQNVKSGHVFGHARKPPKNVPGRAVCPRLDEMISRRWRCRIGRCRSMGAARLDDSLSPPTTTEERLPGAFGNGSSTESARTATHTKAEAAGAGIRCKHVADGRAQIASVAAIRAPLRITLLSPRSATRSRHSGRSGCNYRDTNPGTPFVNVAMHVVPAPGVRLELPTGVGPVSVKRPCPRHRKDGCHQSSPGLNWSESPNANSVVVPARQAILPFRLVGKRYRGSHHSSRSAFR